LHYLYKPSKDITSIEPKYVTKKIKPLESKIKKTCAIESKKFPHKNKK